MKDNKASISELLVMLGWTKEHALRASSDGDMTEREFHIRRRRQLEEMIEQRINDAIKAEEP